MADELYQKVNDKLTSRSVNSFIKAADFFQEVFEQLTSKVAMLDDSEVEIDIKLEKEAAYFHILEYALELTTDRDSIVVSRGGSASAEIIGYVRFKDQYSFVQFVDEEGGVEDDFYLTREKVRELFLIAFEPLLREKL